MYTLRYTYNLNYNNPDNGDCTLTGSYAGQTVDTVSFDYTSLITLGWLSKTSAPFLPASDSGSFSFKVTWDNGEAANTGIKVDNIVGVECIISKSQGCQEDLEDFCVSCLH